jgi:hypothetical protein
MILVNSLASHTFETKKFLRATLPALKTMTWEAIALTALKLVHQLHKT